MHRHKYLPIFLCILHFLFVSTCLTANAAIDEAKYQKMLAISKEMLAEDAAIKETLTEAKAALPPEDYNVLLNIQDYWEKHEFEMNVKNYLNAGHTESEAWAMEVGSQADILVEAVDVLTLRRVGKGKEGVYEYANTSEKNPGHGMLLVRKIDNNFSVTLTVTQGKMPVQESCRYLGEGILKGNTLEVSTEDDPQAKITITFEGQSARIKASKTANETCEQGITLDGTYTK